MRPRIEAERMLDALRVAILASGRLKKPEAQAAYDSIRRQATGGRRLKPQGRRLRPHELGGLVSLKEGSSRRERGPKKRPKRPVPKPER